MAHLYTWKISVLVNQKMKIHKKQDQVVSYTEFTHWVSSFTENLDNQVGLIESRQVELTELRFSNKYPVDYNFDKVPIKRRGK